MQDRKQKAVEAMEKIKTLIATKELQKGEKIPSERDLSAEFNIPRGYIREAIKQLDFIGVVNVIPQKGVYVKYGSSSELEGILAKTLKLDTVDIRSLLETRASLEVTAAQLAAKRATKETIQVLHEAYIAFKKKAEEGVPGMDENLRFHMCIAEISQNSVIISLMQSILPDVLTFSRNNFSVHTSDRVKLVLKEHEDIFLAIRDKDPERAGKSMECHMKKMSDISEGLDKIFSNSQI